MDTIYGYPSQPIEALFEILTVHKSAGCFRRGAARQQEQESQIMMKIGTISKMGVAILLAVSMAGCSSWDSMSRRQKSTVGGAAVGGVAGAVITNGGILGTIGGAALGGIIGDQVGK